MASSPILDQDAWSRLGAYLARTDVELVPPEQRTEFRGQWEDVTEQEERLEDALLIGLVGGTGVGKSTFINALAGREVSRSGDRRPTTDRVVVYRHVATELPDDVPTSNLSQPQVLHEHDTLLKIILFDFPDFDSVERSHAEILQEYLPELDVVFVVVDDIKYGDRKLYELLAELEHDPANLYVLFNKIDRLRSRYGPDAPRVTQDLLADMREKLTENAGLELSPEQMFAVAARPVLDARLTGTACPDETGIQAVETLLTRYQTEKHRRAAKERNIDARKERLAESLTLAALCDENRAILAEVTSLVDRWRQELDAALLSIPVEIVTETERTGFRRTRLRRAGHAWGIPISLVFTLFAEFSRWRHRALGHQPSELGTRIFQHYRGYFEALSNLRARFGSEFLGSAMAAAGRESQEFDVGMTPEAHSAALAREFQQQLDRPDAKPTVRWKLAAHLPAIGVLAMAVWSRIYPLLASASGTSDRGLLSSLVSSLITTLSPTFLIGTAVGVVLAYAATGLFVWLKAIHRTDVAILNAEEQTRAGIRQYGQTVIDSLDSQIQRLRKEFEQLSSILSPGGRPALRDATPQS